MDTTEIGALAAVGRDQMESAATSCHTGNARLTGMDE
jgi:hypothetical protein